jgi:hypothetical protein
VLGDGAACRGLLITLLDPRRPPAGLIFLVLSKQKQMTAGGLEVTVLNGRQDAFCGLEPQEAISIPEEGGHQVILDGDEIQFGLDLETILKPSLDLLIQARSILLGCVLEPGAQRFADSQLGQDDFSGGTGEH